MDNNRTYVARCAIRYKGSTFEWALRWRKEEPINNKPAISVSLNEVENADVFIILSRDCLHNKILKIWEKISPKPPDFCTQQEFLCKCLSSVPTDYLEHIMQVPVLNGLYVFPDSGKTFLHYIIRCKIIHICIALPYFEKFLIGK